MRECDVIDIIANYSDHHKRYELIIPNCFIQHDSEADLFCIRKYGLCDEFEVKTSRADFLNDKKKFVKYRDITREEYKDFTWDNRSNCPGYCLKSKALADGNLCVNYFWYVCLNGVATLSDIPEYAGFIVVFPDKKYPKIIKDAPKLHRKKITIEEKYQFARKSNYRYWAIRNKINSVGNTSNQT